jgi:hypothetical protein
MLSEFQQKQLWEEWLGAETRANYYADLCTHFRRLDDGLNWAVLLLSSGAAVSFLTKLPDQCKAAIAVVVAGVSLYSILQKNLTKISECTDLSFRWNSLALDCQELWNDIYVEDGPQRLQALVRKDAEISKTAHVLPNDQKRMLKWEEHVLRHRAPNYMSPATA